MFRPPQKSTGVIGVTLRMDAGRDKGGKKKPFGDLCNAVECRGWPNNNCFSVFT